MPNKNKNQISPIYNKENQPSLQDQTTNSPFYQLLYQEINKEEAQVVEGKNSFSQEQQQPEVRIYQNQSPQQNIEILRPEIYSHIHPAIKGLFPPKEFQNFSQASRLQYFLENWEKLTSNAFILNIMKGYQILFLPVPIKKFCLPRISMTPQEEVLVDQEIEQMLRKGAIKVVQQDANPFLNSIFVMPKKESGHHPVINLKNLNHYIPYSHFNMEGSFLLKETLQEGDYMCKIDLKDGYF